MDRNIMVKINNSFTVMVEQSGLVFERSGSFGLKMGFQFSLMVFALGGVLGLLLPSLCKRLLWSDTIVVTRRPRSRFQLSKLTAYQGYYQDIALFAMPLKDKEDNRKPQINPAFPIKVSGSLFGDNGIIDKTVYL